MTFNAKVLCQPFSLQVCQGITQTEQVLWQTVIVRKHGMQVLASGVFVMPVQVAGCSAGQVHTQLY